MERHSVARAPLSCYVTINQLSESSTVHTSIYKHISRIYQEYLINRGYNPRKVQQQFNKVTSIPRENLLTPKIREKNVLFPLVTDFNPRLPNIGKIISSHTRLIYNSPSLAKILPKGSIIPSCRRTKNIKEIERSNNITSETVLKQAGCFKCKGKCDLCRNFLKETEIFTSARTNRIYPIRQHLNCKSKNVIFLVTCKKCSVQYIGSTSNEFKVRFRNHKSTMLTKKNTCEVAIHFNKEKHVISDFEFVIVEQICNLSDNYSVDERLLTRELFGVHNFAPSSHMDSTKERNSIPGIELYI